MHVATINEKERSEFKEESEVLYQEKYMGELVGKREKITILFS